MSADVRFVHPGAIARLFELRTGPHPITPSAFLLGAALATFMDASGMCFVSRATLAARTGCHPRNLSRYLRQLESLGFIRSQMRPGRASIYRLQAGAPAAEAEGFTLPSALRRQAEGKAHPEGNGALGSAYQHTLGGEYQGALGGPDAHKEVRQESKRRNGASRKRDAADANVKLFIDWFADDYEREFARNYVVCGAKDGATVKRLLRAVEVEELKTAARRMFSDPWAREHGASLGLLASQINKWLNGGCEHERLGDRRLPSFRAESLRPISGKYAAITGGG